MHQRMCVDLDEFETLIRSRQLSPSNHLRNTNNPSVHCAVRPESEQVQAAIRKSPTESGSARVYRCPENTAIQRSCSIPRKLDHLSRRGSSCGKDAPFPDEPRIGARPVPPARHKQQNTGDDPSSSFAFRFRRFVGHRAAAALLPKSVSSVHGSLARPAATAGVVLSVWCFRQ